MRIGRHSRTCALLVLLLPGATACHSYVPVNPGAVPRSAEVRVHLEEPARERLAAMLPPERQYLDGRLVEHRGDTLGLEVSLQANSEYVQSRLLVQRVSLGSDDVISIELRQLNRWRTALATSAIAIATIAVAIEVFSGSAGGGKYPPIDYPPGGTLIPAFGTPVTPVWSGFRR